MNWAKDIYTKVKNKIFYYIYGKYEKAFKWVHINT